MYLRAGNDRHSRSFHWMLVLTLIALPLLTAATLSAQEKPLEMHITAGDLAAAKPLATNLRYHLFLANTPAAKNFSWDSPGAKFSSPAHPRLPITTLPSPPAGSFFYPDDVEKVSLTGKTIVRTISHPIYLNTASCGGTVAKCWGNPGGFLTDLGNSSMIHIVDQYTGSTANGRYIVETGTFVTAAIYPGTSGVPTFSENDILGVVHTVAKAHGAGYGRVYHLFLPPGVDTCMDEGPCYSPDFAPSFVFCAYHFTVTFADIGNTYYTVEPFQNVPGCQLPTGTPNGQLIDSTNNVLSHELFETISDPDIFTGYRAVNSSFGEIGDLCVGFFFSPVTLGLHKYALQAEYSDKYEACATTP